MTKQSMDCRVAYRRLAMTAKYDIDKPMPYLILLAGIALAIFGLYRFLLKAEKRQVKALFLAVAAIGVGIGSLIFALTGKLPAALAILTALWPLGASYLRNRKPEAPSTLPVSQKEAYEVLGLSESASEEDIRAAHLRLMKKVHPDQQGTDWLARKINAARDILLKQ